MVTVEGRRYWGGRQSEPRCARSAQRVRRCCVSLCEEAHGRAAQTTTMVLEEEEEEEQEGAQAATRTTPFL